MRPDFFARAATEKIIPTGWLANEPIAIGGAETVHRSCPTRKGGARGRPATILAVRVGNDLYIRSYRGPSDSWYSRAIRDPRGTIRASRLEQRVWFDDAGVDMQQQIDGAYQTKYASYGSSYVERMVGPRRCCDNLRLQPSAAPGLN